MSSTGDVQQVTYRFPIIQSKYGSQKEPIRDHRSISFTSTNEVMRLVRFVVCLFVSRITKKVMVGFTR